MNTEKKAKNYSERYFSKLMNNAVFGKTMGNVRKHRDVKTKLSYYKAFRRISISNRNEKTTHTLMNKPVYLGFSILKLSKKLMSEFWYSFVNPIILHGYRQFHCIHKNRCYL